MYQRNSVELRSYDPNEPPCHTPDGVFGIDFWHAVEFSRSGRAPIRGLSARSRGNRSNLLRRLRDCQTRLPGPPAPARAVTAATEGSRRSVTLGAARGNGHRSGVRRSLPGDVENIRQSPRGNANPQVSASAGALGHGGRVTAADPRTRDRGQVCACRAAAPATPVQQVAPAHGTASSSVDPGVVDVGAALRDRPAGRRPAGRQPGRDEQVDDRRPAAGRDVDHGRRQLGQRGAQRARRRGRRARPGRTAPGWRRPTASRSCGAVHERRSARRPARAAPRAPAAAPATACSSSSISSRERKREDLAGRSTTSRSSVLSQNW